MVFLTSDQHWDNLVEKNKKASFVEESDFALINIIPGKFPQYGGDCPKMLRQVAYIDIPNVVRDKKRKNNKTIKNELANPFFEDKIYEIQKLREEIFISIIKLEILESKLFDKNIMFYNNIIKENKSNIQSSLDIIHLNNSFKVNPKEILNEKNIIENNNKFSFKKIFKLCV
uniref:Uncharacterized protein n=1 Tax=Strongyloides stercoralis TaxID=6248 RepID=A0A0K0EDA0_STRER